MEGLVNYSDSDDSDTSINVELKNSACSDGEVNSKAEPIKEETIQSNKRKLPSISELFESKSAKIEVDDLGKKRTIPHRRGNWATHIFLEITITASTTQKIKNLIAKLKELNLSQINHITDTEGDKVKLKVSLSKTWYLAWSFHDKFLTELETKLKGIKKFIINYSNWQLFSNEDFSRLFISLNIGKGHNKVEELGLKVDQLAKLFNLEEFYKPPKYHSSVAWFLPIDNCSEVDINQKLGECREFGDDVSYLVGSIWCQIGNKRHEIKLS